MKIAGIYAIKQISTGIQYIGSSVNISRRWNKHRSDLNSGKHHAPWLQRSWTKHGATDFEFLLLETVKTLDDLRERERVWLLKADVTFNNMQASNRCGVLTHGEQTRIQMATSQKIRFQKNPMGPISDEQKMQISTAQKGKTVTAATREKQSIAAKKRCTSEIMREKGAKGLKNRIYNPMSEDQKNKLSISHKGKTNSPEHREKIRISMIKAHSQGRHKNGFQPKQGQCDTAAASV